MVAKIGAKAGKQPIVTSTSTASKEFGSFEPKECLYHHYFGIQNHNYKAESNESMSTSTNRVSSLESSMVIAAVASQVSSRQSGVLLCKYMPTTVDYASNAATNAKACNQRSK